MPNIYNMISELIILCYWLHLLLLIVIVMFTIYL